MLGRWRLARLEARVERALLGQDPALDGDHAPAPWRSRVDQLELYDRVLEARRAATPVARLRVLAADDRRTVRSAVASNRSCPEDLRLALYGDPEVTVRRAAAR